MATYFWDTSALAKHYHPELGTVKVDRLLAEPGARHIISRLTATELFSVFAGKVRAGLIMHSEFLRLCHRFLADARGKLFLVARLKVIHFLQAETILRTYGPMPGQGIRTLDSLQLAVASDLRGKEPIDALVSADIRFLTVARLESLPVINPEIP